MCEGLKIVKAGLLDSLQDLGRFGYANAGFAVGGVMDFYSTILLNILLDNDWNEALIEINLMGGEYEFREANLFALGGANMQAKLNDTPLESYHVYEAKKGDRIKFGIFKHGAIGYFAVAGGFNLPLFMGSKSSDLRLKCGGFGRKLLENDLLRFYKPKLTLPKLHLRNCKDWLDSVRVRAFGVIVGPQDSYFSKEQQELFYKSSYIITPQSNRMGFRLKGNSITSNKQMYSDGVAFGSIQIPNDGCPIILMADRQSTGGYPKIGNVISYDLPRLAQTKIQSEIYFKSVCIETAQNLLKRKKIDLFSLHDRLQNTSKTL